MLYFPEPILGLPSVSRHRNVILNLSMNIRDAFYSLVALEGLVLYRFAQIRCLESGIHFLPFFKCDLPFKWIACGFYYVRNILKVVLGYIKLWLQLHTASINVCLLNPKSVGKVTLAALKSPSNNKPSRPRVSSYKVNIDPGYLSDPQDLEALWLGWDASTTVKQQWFGRCTEILPGLPFVTLFAVVSFFGSALDWLGLSLWEGPAVKDANICQSKVIPSWFSAYVAEFTNPYYHWCGTCAMGEGTVEDNDTTPFNDSSYVVDEELHVRGIKGLRVCDASVFPSCISAPTALTCAALGHAVSCFIPSKRSESER